MPSKTTARRGSEGKRGAGGGRLRRLVIELDRETDGRWIAEVPALPGVLAYGATRGSALAAVKALALRVVADRLEHGEAAPALAGVAFA